jgi:hypothetical protein
LLFKTRLGHFGQQLLFLFLLFNSPPSKSFSTKSRFSYFLQQASYSLPTMNTTGEDPDTSPIAEPDVILDRISRRAEDELHSQPLPTQRSLTILTRQIFDHYTKHGTAVSLRLALTRYFKPDSKEKEKLQIMPPLPLDYTFPSPNPEDSRMVDEESRHLVRDMPFRVDRKFHIRPNVKLPEGLFETINRIFCIYQFQAEAMLTHACEKYGDEPIFRVGIRSLIMR